MAKVTCLHQWFNVIYKKNPKQFLNSIFQENPPTRVKVQPLVAQHVDSGIIPACR